MLISGFTIVRNAVTLGYPIVESITSILPIVDEFVIGVGRSDDGTRELVESIGDPRIRIFDTDWKMTPGTGARIMADKTNEALDHCSGEWCFYIQADEVLHERDLPTVRATCERLRGDTRVEGLLFRYLHHYGNYSVISTARNAYRQEVRIVRRSARARSVGDAQSFLIEGTRKPAVRWSGGTIHHYGWVHPPERMRLKRANRAVIYERPELAKALEASRQIYGLKRFEGSHPAVMREIVTRDDTGFVPVFSPREWNKRDYRNLASDLVETVIRRRLGERKKFVLLRDTD